MKKYIYNTAQIYLNFFYLLNSICNWLLNLQTNIDIDLYEIYFGISQIIMWYYTYR